ncbi:hypothetical protein O4J55_08950 [Paracoccus sp. PXZ]
MTQAARAIIHVGMHKTGTSSIQDSYFRFRDSSFEYVNWASGNHSALFILLFQDEDKLTNYHGFASRGDKFIAHLPQLRATWRSRLEAQISAEEGKTLLFSAEGISHPEFAQADRRLAAFFRERCDRVDVIGYVRAPQSFAASAFQQYLKGGYVSTKPKPHYRARFEKIDHAFGRENVTLREFARGRLIGGDVVRDFAETVGISMPPDDQILRSNESLSLEATALLYVQRKYGQGFIKGFNAAEKANNAFIARLAQIGTRKLAFSETMMAPMLDEIADDIAWMEERLGHAFCEAGTASPDAISSLDDLVEIALENYDKVLKALGEDVPKAGGATLETLVNALEDLREKSYTEAAPVPARPGVGTAERGSFAKRNFDMAKNPNSPTEEELTLRRKLANILWHMDMGDAVPATREERAEAFKTVRVDYRKKATKLLQQFENNKLFLIKETEQA